MCRCAEREERVGSGKMCPKAEMVWRKGRREWVRGSAAARPTLTSATGGDLRVKTPEPIVSRHPWKSWVPEAQRPKLETRREQSQLTGDQEARNPVEKEEGARGRRKGARRQESAFDC